MRPGPEDVAAATLSDTSLPPFPCSGNSVLTGSLEPLLPIGRDFSPFEAGTIRLGSLGGRLGALFSSMMQKSLSSDDSSDVALVPGVVGFCVAEL